MTRSTKQSTTKPPVGWREWVSLPDLGVDGVKAKIDTGARTSSLHAWDIETFTGDDGDEMIRFSVHPLQRDNQKVVTAEARLLETRWVTSSTGTRQLRPVIETIARIGTTFMRIELTLTSRDVMGFRMLLGREALRGRFLVDPGRSFLQATDEDLIRAKKAKKKKVKKKKVKKKAAKKKKVVKKATKKKQEKR